jgi:hypothetical protein
VGARWRTWSGVAGVEVLAPEALRDELARLAAEVLAVYR